MNVRHTLALIFVLVVGCGESHAPGDDDGGSTPAPDASPAPLDAGEAPIDAPLTTVDTGVAPSPCDGLGPVACMRAEVGAMGCVPDFDDACCSTCEPTTGCADCQRSEYHSCQPYAAACLGGPSCGVAPIWGCGPAAASCDTAHVADLDSCTQPGCVPAYPSGTGEPDLATAICVPIVVDSCTVSCRRIEPPCPTGMVPEGDGFCYTDRCIPAFVCE